MAANKIDVKTLIAESSALSRFTKLDADRSAVLTRARDCAKLTIPSVVPDSGHSETQQLETPYQAVGARLVNNLASKLLLSLLPPNTSFFRILPAEEIAQQVKQQSLQSGGSGNELEQNLMVIEQEMMKAIEREAIRVPVYDAVKSLIISGNGLLYKTEKGLKSYKLGNYVILRDFNGNVIEVITKEAVNKNTLTQDILDQLSDDAKKDETGVLDVFTRAVLKDNVWYEWQEVADVFVEGSDTTYTDFNTVPFIPLRWTAINGEHYGRGLVEQYIGDFRSLEGLYQLLLEASSVMARVIFGKRPGSTLDAQDLNDAENGECINGDLEQDITVLQVGKNGDLQVPLQMIQDLIRRLEQAFLVASSATRDSERTTATEVRYMAADLEQSLGGIYSILSLEFQRPLAYLLLKQSKVTLPKGMMDVVIVTGIEALGRNLELDKLRQLNRLIQELGSPELVLQRMNLDAYIARIGTALSLDTTDLIKNPQQIQQEQQQAQQQQLLAQGAGNLVDGATKPQQQGQ